MIDSLLSIDYSILHYIMSNLRGEILTIFMRGITILGDFGMIWIVISLLLLIRHRTRRCGIAMLFALLIGAILGEGILKHAIMRSRPFTLYADLPALIAPPLSSSFPSGHTLSGFAAATVLFCRNRKIGIGAYALAALIAFSRLYLSVHFPSDVVAGMLLGIGVGVFSHYLTNYVLDKLHYRRLR